MKRRTNEVNNQGYSMSGALHSVIDATSRGDLDKTQSHILLVLVARYADWQDGSGVEARTSTIAAACGMTRQTVSKHIRGLEQLGWISVIRQEGRAHKITVTPLNLSNKLTGGVKEDDRGCKPALQGVSISLHQPKDLPNQEPTQGPKEEVVAAQDSEPDAHEGARETTPCPPDKQPEPEPEPEPPRHSGDDLQRLESWLVDQLEDYRRRADSTGSAIGEAQRLMSGLSEQLRSAHAPNLRQLCKTARAMCLEMACRDERPGLHRATGYLLEDLGEWLDEQIALGQWTPAPPPAPVHTETPEQQRERNLRWLELTEEMFGDEFGLSAGGGQ